MTSTFPHAEENDKKSTRHPDIASAIDLAAANLDSHAQNGWWPYVLDRGPSTEATAWCALALHANRLSKKSSDKTDLTNKCVAYLLNKQNADGGWSTAPGCGASDWSSAPAVLALRLLRNQQEKPDKQYQNKIDDAVIKGANFLFDLRNDPYHSVARFLLFLQHGESGLHYARGWPWTKDCSFWVEPTCYSMLALKLPKLMDRSIIQSALRHASMYIHSHVCQDGGWNHGANFVLEVYAPSYSLTTAEVLLALQDEPRSPVIEKALKRISGDHPDSDSSLPLAWAILALHAYGKDLGNKPAQLLHHQKADGSFGTNNVVTSVALLALLAASANCNLLKMSD